MKNSKYKCMIGNYRIIKIKIRVYGIKFYNFVEIILFFMKYDFIRNI